MKKTVTLIAISLLAFLVFAVPSIGTGKTVTSPGARGVIILQDSSNARPQSRTVAKTQENPTQEKVRFYIKDPPDGDNIYAGMPIGTIFSVQVWIDSPSEWYDTRDGIVGYTISVKVDPAILEPIRATTVPDLDSDGWQDGFLDEFCKYKEWTWDDFNAGTCSVGGGGRAVNITDGTITGFAQFIVGFGSLGVGAGGSGMLMWFWFKSKSATEYSLIDFIDARCTNAGSETYTVGVVEDGHYNYPSEL